MAYVTLDGNGKITGIFANPQPQLSGFATIADNDVRIAAFNNPPVSQYASKIAQGITIGANSASVPVATFALDHDTQSDLQGVASIVAFTGAFPGGGTTFTYPDITSNPQIFPTIAAFKSFMASYSALILQMKNALATLQAGGTATWPSQTVTPT